MKVSESRKKFNTHSLQWKKSGLSKTEYCKLHNIKYSWFLNYFSSTRHKQGFEKVKISSQVNTIEILDGEVKLCYPDGKYFIFKAGVSVALLKALLR